MPHKCVKCGNVYPNNAEELMKGCSCTSRIFLFLRDDQVTVKEQVEMMERKGREFVSQNKQLEEIAEIAPLSIENVQDEDAREKAGGADTKLGVQGVREKIVSEARNAGDDLAQEVVQGGEARLEQVKGRDETPAAENINILEKGVYELDIKSLMAGNPLVIRSDAGVFYIRIPSTLRKVRQ